MDPDNSPETVFTFEKSQAAEIKAEDAAPREIANDDHKNDDLKKGDSTNTTSKIDQATALLEELLDPKQPTPEEAITIISSALAQENRLKYERLHSIIIRHEDTIRTRLRKKTWAWRREMFTSGWPNMTKNRHAVSIRDNALARYLGSVGVPSDEAALPYINEENLKDRKKLLCFINSRGRHPPHVFAQSEQYFMTTGRIVDVEGALTKVYLSDEDLYGTTRHFETEEEAEEFEVSGRGKGIGASLQILHAQNRILNFLIHCCEKVLDNIDSSDLISDQYLIKAEPPALLGDKDVTATFLESTSMQPFLAPVPIDFRRLRHLIGMTVQGSEDHAWLLREHPGYFAETYKNIIDTDTFFLEDVNGTPCLDPLADGAVSRTLEYLIARSLYMVVVWEQLAFRLRELEDICVPDSAGDQSLLNSQKHFETILAVRYVLEPAKCILLNELQSFQADPYLEMCYARETQISNWRKYEIVRTPEINQDPLKKQVCLLLENLAFDKRYQWKTLEGVHFALDLLQTFLDRNSGARQHVSPSIDEVLFKLSVIAEVHHRLALQPWYRKSNFVLEAMSEEDQNTILAHVSSPFKAWGNIAEAKIKNDRGSKLVTELYLDIFWRHVDNRLLVLSNNVEQETLKRLLDRAGTMKRTVPWEERQRAVAAAQNADGGQDVSHEKPLSEYFHDHTKEITGNFDKSSISAKAKGKTRGTFDATAAVADGVAQGEPEEAPAEARREYIVNKKNFKVMHALFSMPEDNEQPSKLRWIELVGALVALGFSSRHTYGSVWRFDPSPALALGHAINLHAPHPGDEVSHEVARRIERRLNRAYGWEGAMFRMKE